LDYVEDKKDLWLIYEVCKGQTMNEAMFEVKGKFAFHKKYNYLYNRRILQGRTYLYGTSLNFLSFVEKQFGSNG
jgi:hypothetical protein